MHVTKLPNGQIVECKCAYCRTMMSGEEFFSDPIEELPRPMRWYLKIIYPLILLTVLGTFVYVYMR